MSERYENWEELFPMLDDPIEGAVCVCLADGARFKAGDIVTLLEGYDDPECERADGVKGMMLNSKLALLPSEEPAKVERKIVNGFCDLAGYVHAVCDDGTMWYYGNGVEQKWHKMPPIPHGAVWSPAHLSHSRQWSVATNAAAKCHALLAGHPRTRARVRSAWRW